MLYGTRCRTAFAILTLFTGLTLPAVTSAQGLVDGFMRGEGKLDVALTYSHESYSQYFVGNTLAVNALTGETPKPSNPNLGTITTQSVSLYAAHGIHRDIDVIVNVPYVTASADAGYWSSQSGVQDLSFAVKWRPVQVKVGDVGTFDLMAAAGVAIPLTNYVNDAPVAIGHYSTNFDGRLLAQFTTGFGLFASAQGGYIRRNNIELDRGFETIVPDAVDVWGKIGYTSELFYLDAWIQRQNAQGGTNIGPGISFPSNGVSFTRVGLNGYYPIPFVDGLGITLGGALTLDGRNVGKSTRISAGIAYGINLY